MSLPSGKDEGRALLMMVALIASGAVALVAVSIISQRVQAVALILEKIHGG